MRNHCNKLMYLYLYQNENNCHCIKLTRDNIIPIVRITYIRKKNV